jgi:hypothetical protein
MVSMNLRTLTAAFFMLASFGAYAQSPHFIKLDTSFNSVTGEFCVDFKEAGLGNTPITYRLNVDSAIFTFQCFTRKGNTPQGDPNFISLSNDFVETTVTPHNGQVTASLCLDPSRGNAGCQGGGLRLKLIHILLSGVTFCDVTNNICESEGDVDEDVFIAFGGGKH